MRIEPRYAYQIPVALLRNQPGLPRQEIGCRLEDLSLSGLRVSLKGTEELAPGEQVFLTLVIREKHIPAGEDETVTVSLRAEVIWRRERDCGLKITAVKDSDMAIYEELIDSLKKD
jgi:hypothetical protein